jgi:hypothetical protein
MSETHLLVQLVPRRQDEFFVVFTPPYTHLAIVRNDDDSRPEHCGYFYDLAHRHLYQCAESVPMYLLAMAAYLDWTKVHLITDETEIQKVMSRVSRDLVGQID